MLHPSEDGFLTQLQETGVASATVTATDDLCITVPTIETLVATTLAAEVRIFVRDRTRRSRWQPRHQVRHRASRTRETLTVMTK